jgi:MerR HTH family regulatory protein
MSTATNPDSTKTAVLKLLSEGKMTLSEVARLSGESKQRIDYWARQAKISPPEAREAHLAALWNAAIARGAKRG